MGRVDCNADSVLHFSYDFRNATNHGLLSCYCDINRRNGFESIESSGYDFKSYDIYANLGRDKPLYFWKKTSVGRPGVHSIADAYFAFRIVELVQSPQISGQETVEQRHRTSVWSQLYGRANFAQFEQHPQSWITHDESN